VGGGRRCLEVEETSLGMRGGDGEGVHCFGE